MSNQAQTVLKTKLTRALLVLMALTIALTSYTAPVSAVNLFHKANGITYTGDEVAATCSSSVTTVTGNLPAETASMLEAQDIKGKAEANMERYQHAESQTGVPWQVIAAIHYREATMDPNKSIADGSPLTAGVSADGLPINSDPNIDAANMANHFLSMASSVYGLDKGALASWTLDSWGQAFLAYNRGYMYKSANQPYTNSPYVMNFLDDAHMNMQWIKADSYSGSKRLNGLFDNGTKDTRPGALVIASYLGFSATAGSGGTANCSGPGAVSGDIAQTAINLSWPDGSHGPGDPNPAYKQAMKDVGLEGVGCSRNGADCAVFVATVMRTSGADKDFPTGTSVVKKYLADSPNYTKIETKDTSGLQPGDIFIVVGHTFMYVGDSATDGGKNMAAASCGEQTGNRANNVYFEDTRGRGTYEIYRKK